MEGSTEFSIDSFEIATEMDDRTEIHEMEVESQETSGKENHEVKCE